MIRRAQSRTDEAQHCHARADTACRPAVDVVVPFSGDAAQRQSVVERLRVLRTEPRDGLFLVDNGPLPPPSGDRPAILHAPERPTSYFARSRGAAQGEAEWILFLDADVHPPADLLDRYFDPPPDPDVAVLAGAVDDEPPADGLTVVARYFALRAPMAQDNTLSLGYAQTANCAVRRSAFEEVGGFDERVRSGGDADLCFRLAEAGWSLASRPQAAVVHYNRTTLWALARQRARHGSGGAWLNRRYPGRFPANRSPGVIWWSVRELAAALRHLARSDIDRAVVASVGVVSHWAYEVGRLLPNTPRRRDRRTGRR